MDEISAGELARRLEAGETIHIVDVRAPDRLAQGRIETPAGRFHNIPGSRLLRSDPDSLGIPRDALLAVVCGHGRDSRLVAEHLRGVGYHARSLHGGLVAWMSIWIPRPLPTPPLWDRLLQLDRPGKGALSYVLVSGGEALVVDPPRQVERIVGLVDGLGAGIVGVVDTHAHADYVSGGVSLARQAGVPFYLHPADAKYPFDDRAAEIEFVPATEGLGLRVGEARVTVVHTPGHTEGSVCLELGEEAALTGDFLFVRSVGRPDLGGRSGEWARDLFASLERVRREWSDRLIVYPGHYSSEDERNDDRSIGRALGDLASFNEPFAMRDRERFLRWVEERVGAFPDAYRAIKAVNLGLLSLLDEELDGLEAGRNLCALG